MRYFITILVHNTTDNYYFAVGMQSNNQHEEGKVISALRDMHALENDDEVLSICYKAVSGLGNLDSVMAKYDVKLCEIAIK